MKQDWRTTTMGVICALILIAMTIMLIMGKIDAVAYSAALAAVSAFCVSLIGIFSRDAKNKTT